MTIRLLRNINNVGVANDVVSLNADREAALVSANNAVYVSGPDIGDSGVPVMGKIDPVTGGIEIYAGSVIAPMAQRLYCSSGLPFVLPSSGTINNASGSVTVSTAFDAILGPSYTYFPSGALFSSSPAGWYYTDWTSATMGTVYADVYINGTPRIPAVPTPLVTVAGAYTQTTGLDIIGPNVVVPGNSMGDSGSIEWQRAINNNNSAGQKVYNVFFGGTVFQGVTQTTNPKAAGEGSLKNRGRKTAQVAANSAYGDSGAASTINRLTIDTSQSQILSMGMRLSAATDYAITESFAFKVFHG